MNLPYMCTALLKRQKAQTMLSTYRSCQSRMAKVTTFKAKAEKLVLNLTSLYIYQC